MIFAIEKLQRRIPEIQRAAIRASMPVEPVMAHTYGAAGVAGPGQPPVPPPPTGILSGATRLTRGQLWGQPYGNVWLQGQLRLPADWEGEPLLTLSWEGSGLNSIESLLYIDGQLVSGIDECHRSIVLPPAMRDGGAHALALFCFTPQPQPFGGLMIQRRDPAIYQLGIVMQTVLETVQLLPEHQPERHHLLGQLNAAYNHLDLRDGYEAERFAASAVEALAMLRAGLEAGGHTHRARIVATGHGHLDVAWLWPLWRTRQKVVHTVANQLHLMEQYPALHFSMSQPQVYAFLKADAPVLYERMRAAVAAGRFEPVGAMWLESDCNLTSGESLVRQLLHGTRFFQDEFGLRPRIIWLPDVFGYSPALPQIMRQAGLHTFITTKISWSQINRFPYDTFRWRGIDGSEVLAHFVTSPEAGGTYYTYNAQLRPHDVMGCWQQYRQQALNTELLSIYGNGDGGGGPTEEMQVRAGIMADLPGMPTVRQGRVDAFCEALYARLWPDARLPTWSGELYLEYHRGTYTSQARIKQANRRAELACRTAEWLASWAQLLGDAPRQARLNEAWQLVLLNQFHDILPGSSIRQVYTDAATDYARIEAITADVCDQALATIAREQGYMGMVLANPLPWDRSDPAVIAGEYVSDTDHCQYVPESDATLVDGVALPGYGLAPLVITATPAPALHVDEHVLENERFRLELDDRGEIGSLYDKHERRELVAPGQALNRMVAYEDRPISWNAWDIDLFYEEKAYPLHTISGWSVVERGPVRAAIELARPIGRSLVRQRICLWRRHARIDFITDIVWHERQTLLRALFPLNINATRATCEIQFGAIERATHRNTSWDLARFEVSAHRWVDLSEGGYGVALLNDGRYGHSFHHSMVGLSLLRGPISPDQQADLGTHRLTYSLLPHSGDWQSAHVVRRAYELNVPALVRNAAPRQPGSERATQPDGHWLLRCDLDHVVIETIKAAENGDGLIIRLYEAHNRRGHGSITFSHPITSAEAVNLLEERTGPASIDGAVLYFSVRPYEIKTWRVRLSDR